MTPNQYQELALATAKVFQDGISLFPGESDILHATLGIAGEAGEIVDAVKKAFIYGRPLDQENLIEEMGDVLWFVALGCQALGVTMEDVMEQNIAKLKLRYPEKYSDSAAIERKDKQ